jgi:hypothetical protein
MSLITHCGARQVTWGDLDQIPTPPATETWFPLSHSQVLGSVVQTLDAAGFGVKAMALAVTPDDARFFGTLQRKRRILPSARECRPAWRDSGRFRLESGLRGEIGGVRHLRFASWFRDFGCGRDVLGRVPRHRDSTFGRACSGQAKRSAD